MTLTIPSTDDFYTFWGSEADDLDSERAEILLQMSANLFWLATGLESDPVDSRLAFMVKYAIVDGAIYLYVNRDDIDAQYSPFNSERVGSYSYSKAFSKAMQGVTSASMIGAPLFDRVVSYFIELAMAAGGGWTSSESVFHTGYIPLMLEAWWLDPVMVGTRGWLTWDNLRAASDGDIIGGSGII